MQGGHPGTPSLQRLARRHRGGGGSDAGPPASPRAWSRAVRPPSAPSQHLCCPGIWGSEEEGTTEMGGGETPPADEGGARLGKRCSPGLE